MLSSVRGHQSGGDAMSKSVKGSDSVKLLMEAESQASEIISAARKGMSLLLVT
jgi:hypothetical protein